MTHESQIFKGENEKRILVKHGKYFIITMIRMIQESDKTVFVIKKVNGRLLHFNETKIYVSTTTYNFF